MTPADISNKSAPETVELTKAIYIATLHRPDSVLGGIQKHITVFREGLSLEGIKAELLTPFHVPKALWQSAFGIGKLLAASNGPLGAAWYEYSRLKLLEQVLLKYVPKNTPSLIYAQDPVSLEAALTLKQRQYPVELVNAVHFNISTADEWVGKGILKRGSKLYEKMLARDAHVLPQAERLVFVSDFMCEALQARVPEVRKVPSYIVPNFVPSPPLLPIKARRAELITIGTVEPRKNQVFLLQVLQAAHQRGYRYRLTIVGDGPSRKELEAKTKALGLNDYVTFLGRVSNAVSLISEHRAYVHAAHMESFGIVLVEALAAGKPVFAAPVGGIPEVFHDNKEGRYWSLEDPEAAATLLIEVLEDPKRYRQLADAAKARHINYFSTQAVQETLLSAVLGMAP